jgi:hypothetical protein
MVELGELAKLVVSSLMIPNHNPAISAAIEPSASTR